MKYYRKISLNNIYFSYDESTGVARKYNKSNRYRGVYLANDNVFTRFDEERTIEELTKLTDVSTLSEEEKRLGMREISKEVFKKELVSLAFKVMK